MRRMIPTSISINLDEALKEAQRRHVIIIPRARSVSIWSPNKRVPHWLRQAIKANQRQILLLIARSETTVCPSPELHRASWDYIVKRYCCDICSRLVKEVS